MCRLTSSFSKIPVCHLVRNVTVQYAHWWYEVAGTTCVAVHISMPPTALKKKGTMFDPPLSEKTSPSRGERRRGDRRRSKGKKTISTSPTPIIDFESYFSDIELDTEELTIEAPPPSRKMRDGPKKRMGHIPGPEISLRT